MAVPKFFKGIFTQSAILAGISLPLGFYLMQEGGEYYDMGATGLLWPIVVANKLDVLVADPLASPLKDYVYMSAFAQFVGYYVILFFIHMTIRKRWSFSPRHEKSKGLPRWRRRPNDDQ